METPYFSVGLNSLGRRTPAPGAEAYWRACLATSPGWLDDGRPAEARHNKGRLAQATGGGGGIGIYICRSHEEVVSQYSVASRQGKANFGDAGEGPAAF